jgi:hypothetical protein
MDNIKISLFGVVLALLVLPVQAGIYKWVDENGKVHYSQTPPPKEGRGATINTDTFNSVKTVKAPPVVKRTPRPKPKVVRTKVRRIRCNRR